MSRIWIASFATFAACDKGEPEACPVDLPTDWECAEQREVVVDSVELCAQIYEDPTPAVALDPESGVNEILVTNVVFRQEQAICGYSTIESSTVLLLLQPCEMRPDATIKAGCVYDFSVSLGEVPGDVTDVNVSTRHDFMSDDVPPVVEVGTVALP